MKHACDQGLAVSRVSVGDTERIITLQKRGQCATVCHRGQRGEYHVLLPARPFKAVSNYLLLFMRFRIGMTLESGVFRIRGRRGPVMPGFLDWRSALLSQRGVSEYYQRKDKVLYGTC